MRAGNRVVCINAAGSANLLREGHTYTMAAPDPDGYIYLDGVPVLYPGFWVTRSVGRRIFRFSRKPLKPCENSHDADR